MNFGFFFTMFRFFYEFLLHFDQKFDCFPVFISCFYHFFSTFFIQEGRMIMVLGVFFTFYCIWKKTLHKLHNFLIFLYFFVNVLTILSFRFLKFCHSFRFFIKSFSYLHDFPPFSPFLTDFYLGEKMSP